MQIEAGKKRIKRKKTLPSAADSFNLIGKRELIDDYHIGKKLGTMEIGRGPIDRSKAAVMLLSRFVAALVEVAAHLMAADQNRFR